MEHQYQRVYKNVRVCPLQNNHIEYLRQWRNETTNTRYLRKIGEITPEMQEQWYERYLKNEDEMCFAIYENETIDNIVGSASLYNFEGEQAEFGKILIGDEKAHGKNIGYHALKAILDIAFDELQLDRIILECHEHNKAAFRIYEKAGFVVCGSHAFADGCQEYDMELSKVDYKKGM